MAFTEYTKDTTIIGALGTNPAERALTTQEFKDKFDQFAEEFVEWFNATHIVEANAHLAETATDADGVHGLKIESGTFTPTIVGSTTAGNNTYSVQGGIYYKVGDLVHCNIMIVMTAKDSSMAGNATIAGLPFVSKNSGDCSASVPLNMFSYLVLPSNDHISGYIGSNTSAITLYSAGNNTEWTALAVSAITGTTHIMASFSYLI